MQTDCLTIRRICSVALMLGITAVAGCEQESARERAEVSKQLQEAQQQLDVSLNDESKLQNTIKTLRGINGGTKQQQASRDLMMASAELDIAGIKTKAMQQLETRMRHELSYVSILVGNAAALQQFIDQRQISPSDLGADQFQQSRQALGSQLQNLDRQVDRMQEPISEMEQVNADQARRIRDLRRAAEALRQEQYELGLLEGFAVFQRSIEADREANAIELELSNRQIVLDLESKPIHRQTKQARDHVKEYIDEVDASHEGLQAMANLQSSRSEAARDLQLRTDATINDAYTTFAEQDTGPLTADIQTISGLLESAAKHARSGGRNVPKDAKNAAVLLETRAQMDLLLLQSHRVRSLQERLAMLERMAACSFLSNRDTYELQGRKIQETSDQFRTMAIATSQSIEQTLRGVRGGEVDSIRTAVQQIAVGLGAEPPPPAPAPASPAPATAPAPAPAPAASSGPRFDTPEALIKYTNSLVSNPLTAAEWGSAWLSISDSSGKVQQQMLQQLRDAEELSQGFEEFLMEATKKFPNDPEIQEFQNMFNLASDTPMPGISDMKLMLPTLKMTSDTTATVRQDYGMDFGIDLDETKHLIKTADGWKFDMNADYEALSPEERKLGERLVTMFTKLKTVLRQTTADLRNGQFTTAKQLSDQMNKRFMEAMQGGLMAP